MRVKDSCYWSKISVSNCPFSIFFVSLRVFHGTVQPWITLKILQRRGIMKISKGINQFFNYQKLNVKKKYNQEL